MIKHGIFKVAGVCMAGGAGTSPVICGWRVAARTILRPNGVVVKHGIGEVFGVAVAGGTGTREVIGGWGVTGGAVLTAHQAVIEGNGRPLRHLMAGGTIGAKLAVVGLVFGMAADAVGGGAFIGAARVAAAAFQVVVTAH